MNATTLGSETLTRAAREYRPDSSELLSTGPVQVFLEGQLVSMGKLLLYWDRGITVFCSSSLTSAECSLPQSLSCKPASDMLCSTVVAIFAVLVLKRDASAVSKKTTLDLFLFIFLLHFFSFLKKRKKNSWKDLWKTFAPWCIWENYKYLFIFLFGCLFSE